MTVVSIDALKQWTAARKMTFADLPVKVDLESPTVDLDQENVKRLTETLAVPLHCISATSDSNSSAREDDLDEGVKIAKQSESYVRTAARGGVTYYTYRHLAKTRTAPHLMPLRITVHCADEGRVVMNTHSCPEFVYVSSGPVRFHWTHTDSMRSKRLETGDSVYIAPDVEHSFTCLENEAEIIAVNF